ncbi:MAG: rhodanese-like domain-containing protein [Gammaproteobacteria bacterium]|jgi:rhodanese-related sulfurtransferase|nr:rhodanese-like domain-containing protein [Gammaproteobacteria bacterium]MBT4605827.1 rhodanese-like domain-containing protein [Thiotrichales bacterium]MBT3471664.1 rhodanese-like domain-containing protein [Gammaproteobacteria bacterium]MBT3967814.1 rhodanese-like domain-containing protein [Gammaproteobacteria bacterium]MBT4080205.1 rhodanese-like domain-containing protein [Gammaproteobacteria bacterium]
MQELYTFSLNHWELVAAFLITLAMLIFNIFGDQLRGFESISAEAAVRLLNGEDTLLIDVRNKDELTKDGHIKDAKHIPLNKLREKMGDLEQHRSHTVAIICRSGNRSGVACGQLKKDGFEHVYNLKGGILSWKSAGLPVSYK